MAHSPLAFLLDVTRPADHRIRVRLEFDLADLPSRSEAVELFLPVWTPGSYLVREYARHLERFEVRDEGGVAIAWTKVSKSRFRLAPVGSVARLRISYEVYAHELTVRTADVTDRHAYWNGACVFIWPVGGEQLGADIEVSLPPDWRFCSQLPHEVAGATVRMSAPCLDAVVDAPCLAGSFDVESFDVFGIPHHFVLDGLQGISPPDTLVPDTSRIVEEAVAIFGDDVPYGEYHFLSLFSDSGRGGLEHFDSSTLLAPRTTFHPRRDYEDFMGLVAHELFHVWNGRRMRPADLWEFDYEGENYTTLLWVVEGMTAYYDDHICLRAGVIDSKRYLEILGDAISPMQRTPGRLIHPLSAASFDCWIKLYRPDENSRNSTQSYYAHGSLAAMCFDLTIRTMTDGKRCLDDAIGELFRRCSAERRGYDDAEVVQCLSAAAGGDLTGLKRSLVDGPFEPSFEEILEPLGLRLVPKGAGSPRLGIHFVPSSLRIASVQSGGPGHAGGLAPGDEVLALNGLRVERSSWSSVLHNTFVPGRALRVLLSRRGCIRECAVTPSRALSGVRIEPIPGADPSKVRLRRAWLWED